MIILKLVCLSLFVSLYECNDMNILSPNKGNLTEVKHEKTGNNWCCNNRIKQTSEIPTVEKTKIAFTDQEITVSSVASYISKNCGWSILTKYCVKYNMAYRKK